VSYTVLALKWRPRRFEQLVGQPHVVRALVSSLAENRLHHAYLFSGTRGVGKTTIARLLAKALNCDQGIVAEPCGVCAACVAIDEGRFVDLIEVDAASRTRVDDTRELLDNVQYLPTRGRFKVYLIDEVHMLSNHSFNALLKTLEEPPPHVKFLLATTDPQKLPVTVLSRCLQFNLKKLTVAQIQAQLERICTAEGVPAEPDGLKAIARAAEGSMRDALSLLDQGIAFGGGRIEAAAIGSMLGSIDRTHVLTMLDALAAADGAGLLNAVDRLDELSPDYGAVLDELLAALQQIAVHQLVSGRLADPDLARLAPLADKISPEDVQLYYQIGVQGRRDLPVSRDARMGFEMTLLRMLAFRPIQATNREVGAAAAAGASSPAPLHNAPPNSAPPTPPHSAPPTPPHSAPPTPPHSTPPRRRTQVLDPPPAAAGSAPQAVAIDWNAFLQSLDLRGPARQLADNCELGAVNGARWQLVLPPDKSHLNTSQVRARLEAAISEQQRREITIAVVPGQPSRPTPADLRRAGENERMRAAREAIEDDPNVKAVQAAFGAVVEPDSIRSTK
jgi:DNA polymerase-3 subunit gamma/tau